MSTILQIANTDKNLSLLIKGLKAADLEETLNGFGPFTILAPVNMAFGNLCVPDTFENMMKQSPDTIHLSAILAFHILIGKKLMKDLRHGQKLETVHGEELTVTVKDGIVRINNARILTRDRQGSNGVLHSIDIVNIPALYKIAAL